MSSMGPLKPLSKWRPESAVSGSYQLPMGTSRRREGSRRIVGVVLVSIGLGVLALWIISRHMGQSGTPLSALSMIRTQQAEPPLILPPLESIESKEGLPKLESIPWDDFVREGDRGQTARTSQKSWDDSDAITKAGLRKCPSAPQCRTTWSNLYLKRWQMSKEVPKLCEASAVSAIHCHDSPVMDPTSRQDGAKKKKPTRFCEFTNAMLNFRKLRTYGGKRSFERGFLAASCGYTSPENIGINVYNPDIVSSQSCDYVFNETVLVISHSNIKRAWTVLKDYFVVFTMLQLAGATSMEEIRDISLLNIDSIVRGQSSYFNGDRDDDLRGFFYPYHHMFRRVLRASQFPAKSSVCFHRLVWLSRPSDLHRDILGPREGTSATGCSTPPEGSDFFHRWSIYTRAVLGILPASTHPSLAVAVGAGSGGAKGKVRPKKVRHITNSIFQVLLDSSLTQSHSVSNGGDTNHELIDALVNHNPEWHVITHDFSHGSTRDLIQLYSNTSLVISRRGSEALYGAAFMPKGTKNCCGILEVSQEEEVEREEDGTSTVQSFKHHARFMGMHHEEVSIDLRKYSSLTTTKFMKAISRVEGAMDAGAACLLSAALKT